MPPSTTGPLTEPQFNILSALLERERPLTQRTLSEDRKSVV